MRECPDCDVAMEEHDYTTSFHGEHLVVEDDAEGELETRLGLAEEAATAYVCPECSLVRFYLES